MIGELLRRVAAALELNGVPYMLTGSLASSMYGVPRATNDLDFVIAPSREQLLRSRCWDCRNSGVVRKLVPSDRNLVRDSRVASSGALASRRQGV